jgi:hypothetical protein
MQVQQDVLSPPLTAPLLLPLPLCCLCSLYTCLAASLLVLQLLLAVMMPHPLPLLAYLLLL